MNLNMNLAWCWWFHQIILVLYASDILLLIEILVSCILGWMIVLLLYLMGGFSSIHYLIILRILCELSRLRSFWREVVQFLWKIRLSQMAVVLLWNLALLQWQVVLLFQGKGQKVAIFVVLDLLEGHFCLLNVFLNRLSRIAFLRRQLFNQILHVICVITNLFND
jgi:hypothetical protein